MGKSSRERRMCRRRTLLVLVGAVLIVVGFLTCIAMTQGLGFLARFLTVPSLEAESGRKYTPTGAVKRFIEKSVEKDKAEE